MTGVRLGPDPTNYSNSAVISGGVYGVYGYGAPQYLHNSGIINGSYNAVDFHAGGSIANAAGGQIRGGAGGLTVDGGAGTVVNAGTIVGTGENGVVLSDGGAVTNEAGGSISGYGGVVTSNAPVTIANDGTITGNAVDGNGVYMTASGLVANQGLIEARYFGSGVNATAPGVTVVNYGTIASTYGQAVSLSAGDTLVVEVGSTLVGGAEGGGGTLDLASGAGPGTIIGRYSAFAQINLAAGASWTNEGTLGGSVAVASGAYLDNTAGGTVIGTGGVYGVGANAGVGGDGVDLAEGGSLVNAGTISGGAAASFSYSFPDADPAYPFGHAYRGASGGSGIDVASEGSFTNTGTVEGGAGGPSGYGFGSGYGYGFRFPTAAGTGGAGVSLAAAASLTNDGAISGGIGGFGQRGFGEAAGGGAGGAGVSLVAAASLTNDGTITGGAGGSVGYDRYNGGSGGTGGAGVALAGGNFTNAAIVSGGTGGTGANVGGMGPGYQGGAGGVGGAGIVLSGGGSLTNLGTIAGGAGGAGGMGNYYDPGPAGGIGDGIDVFGIAAVTNQAGATIAGRNGVLVTGSYAGAGATIVNDGSIVSAVWPGAEGFGVLMEGAGTVVNEAGGFIQGYAGFDSESYGVTLINYGTIAGNIPVVFHGGGQDTFVVEAGSTMVGGGAYGGGAVLDFAGDAGPGTITNVYGYFSQINVEAGTTWTNDGVFTGRGALTVAGTLTNDTGIGRGVMVSAGGYLDNTATGAISGSYGGAGSFESPQPGGPGGAGVSIATGGSAINDGFISGGSGGRAYYGAPAGAGGAGVAQSDGSFVNRGAITGGQGGRGIFSPSGAGGAGVALSGGSFVNLGTITGGPGNSFYSPSSAVGVGASATGGALINGAAGNNSVLIEGSIGVAAYGAGATVTNYGTIASIYGSGGTAVNLQDGDTLIVEAGSTVVGTAQGGGGTLEFGAGGGPGTITGLGTQYSGFSQYAVLSGAAWTLTGTNVVAGGDTLTNSGTLAFTGTLVDAGTLTSTDGTAVAFGNAASALVIDAGASIQGAIGGFAQGDEIDLAGLSFVANATTASFVNGTLSVSDGTANETLSLSGVAPGAEFNVAADATGGTLVTESNATAPAITVELRHDTGAPAYPDYTKKPALKGTANPGATVTISDGSTILGTAKAGPEGHWLFKPTGLADGTYTLTASETVDGATAQASLSFTLETVAPTVTEALSVDTGAPANPGYTSDPEVTGTAAPDLLVTIKDGGTVLGTAAADANGYWSFAPTGLAAGKHTLVASETNQVGLTSKASLAFTLETTPVVTVALKDDTGAPGYTRDDALMGTADANAIVTISNGDMVIGTTTAGGDGNWKFTPTLADGSYTLTASETDAAGLTGTGSLSFTLDTTPPAVTEQLAVDSGAPGYTNDPEVTGAGDPNATVTISEGKTVLGTTTAEATGAWSLTPTGLADGKQTLVASEADLSGNTGTASLSFTLETIAPVVTEALLHDTGASSVDDITSNPELTGTGEANALVTILNGSTAIGTTTAGSGGNWKYTPALADGAYTLTASETDRAGNTGTAALTLTLDTTPPAVTEALVNPGQNGVTNNPALTGSGDPNALVALTEGKTVLGTTTANGSGVWSFTPTGLSAGKHTLVASETDLAGNTGTASLSFTLDPNLPIVTAALTSPGQGGVTANPTLTGTGSANAVVTISNGSTIIGVTDAASNGAWSFTPSLGDGAYTLTASETDAAGHTGSASVSFALSTGGAGENTSGDNYDTIYGAPFTTVLGGTGTDIIAAPGDTVTGGNLDTIDLGHLTSASGGALVLDPGTTIADTVVGFAEGVDYLRFANETPSSEASVIATAKTHGGNTVITLADHSTITLAGVTHVDTGIFG